MFHLFSLDAPGDELPGEARILLTDELDRSRSLRLFRPTVGGADIYGYIHVVVNTLKYRIVQPANCSKQKLHWESFDSACLQMAVDAKDSDSVRIRWYRDLFDTGENYAQQRRVESKKRAMFFLTLGDWSHIEIMISKPDTGVNIKCKAGGNNKDSLDEKYYYGCEGISKDASSTTAVHPETLDSSA